MAPTGKKLAVTATKRLDARMGDTGHNVLPVVSRANVRIILGVVTLQDLLKAYGVGQAEQVDPELQPQ